MLQILSAVFVSTGLLTRPFLSPLCGCAARYLSRSAPCILCTCLRWAWQVFFYLCVAGQHRTLEWPESIKEYINYHFHYRVIEKPFIQAKIKFKPRQVQTCCHQSSQLLSWLTPCQLLGEISSGGPRNSCIAEPVPVFVSLTLQFLVWVFLSFLLHSCFTSAGVCWRISLWLDFLMASLRLSLAFRKAACSTLST